MQGADRRGRYYTTSQYQTETAAFGDTRGFARLWDTDLMMPETEGEMPGWERGSIIRGSQPAFVLTQLGPVYDPSNPAGWRPGL